MKFLLTFELGRLARWLRILGFDTAYVTPTNPGSLVILALRDNRVIVTRNRRLPHPRGMRIIQLSAERLEEQLPELLKSLHIELNAAIMFSRCIVCNTELKPLAKEEVKEKVPEYVFRTQERFFVCAVCQRVYWQGTHWGNVQKTLSAIQGP